MSTSEQRSTLAAFVRAARERVRPEQVGLPSGQRRRTPGLRREEVASLAGMSVTWYTWLEQGREISVSRRVLDGLAHALLMSTNERDHLFALAGLSLPREPRTQWQVSEPLAALVRALNPAPSYLLTPAWDFADWNDAESGLVNGLHRRPEHERNLLWIVFTDSDVRRLLVQWRQQARSLVAQFRAWSSTHADEHRVRSLVAALEDASADFRSMWTDHEIAAMSTTRWDFDHSRVGRLSFDYVKLAPLESQGLLLFTCRPAGEYTSIRLDDLASWGRQCDAPFAPRQAEGALALVADDASGSAVSLGTG